MIENFEITNGPSREELFDGLRLFAETRLIMFEVTCNGVEKPITIIINSIQAEDGSGQSWNLTLTTDEKFVSPDFFVKKAEIKESGVYASKKFNFSEIRQMLEYERGTGGSVSYAYKIRKPVVVKAYYSTKTRKGVITVG